MNAKVMSAKQATRRRPRLFSSIVLALVMGLALLLGACSALEVGLLDETPVLDPTATVPPTQPAATEPATQPPTEAAEPEVVPTAADTPPPATTGVLSGRVCYPSEFIPAMTAYFQNIGTAAVTELSIAENQATYSIELEPGTYVAYSWRTEYEVGQGVSFMVDDGNGSQRAERLLPLELAAGQTVTANLCDPLPAGFRPANAPDVPPSPAGLVYASVEGVGILDASGQLLPVFERSEAVLSPDGTQVLYVLDDEVWLADLASGQHRNLTNTPDRIEHAPQWWPARPDLVLFSSYAREREILMGPGIFPTLTRLDGTGYTVLFEDSDVYSFAPSPDGVTVAYGLGLTGWLHNFDTGQRTAFDPAQQGLDLSTQPRAPASVSVGNPAFDPTGTRRMAWSVGLFFEDGTNQISTGVFDLDARTAQLLHPYAMAGTDGFPPPARWSPDGQWLAASVWSLDPNEQGLWVWRPDGSYERYLGQGGSATWSPDGRYLAWTDALNSTIASRPQSTDLFALPRPPDHWLVEWRSAP